MPCRCSWAVLAMAVVIPLVDQWFWRPLVAWSDRIRLKQRGSGEPASSWVRDLLRATRLVPFRPVHGRTAGGGSCLVKRH